MSERLIHRETLTEAKVLAAIAEDLSSIKAEDRLTWKEIGRILDKHHDQVPKYADGSATMDVVTFAYAEREWKGRITGRLRRLIYCDPADDQCDRARSTKVLAAALALSIALEDGKITEHEVLANRATIENAIDALKGLLAKLRPVAA